jgi:hypothetical protein
MHRALAATCALAATALVGSLAWASPTFPAAIQEHLDLACKPDCEELIGKTSPNAASEPMKCLDEGSGEDGGCSMTRVTSTDAGAIAWLVAGLYLARPRLRRASERLP